MVARQMPAKETTAPPPAGRLAHVWFLTWRRALSEIARVLSPARRWKTARSTVTDATRFWARPGTFSGLSPTAADRVAVLGMRLFLIGLGASVALGLWRTGGWRSAAGGALTAAVWTFARLGVLLWLVPGDRRLRVVVTAVWAASLAPFGLAVTEGLRLGALAASAALCLGTLRGVGLPERDVRTMVGWSFGGQAVVTLGGLAARALLALVLA